MICLCLLTMILLHIKTNLFSNLVASSHLFYILEKSLKIFFPVVIKAYYQVRTRVAKIPGGGNGNPLQYSCLGNPMDRGV